MSRLPRHLPHRCRTLALAAAVAALPFVPSVARSQTYTHNWMGGNYNNWGQVGAFSRNVVSSATSDFYFGLGLLDFNGITNQDIQNNFQLRNLYFTNQNWTMTGLSLLFASGGNITSTGNTVSISNNIGLQGSLGATISGGTTTLSGSVSGGSLTKSGAGTLAITGSLSTGTIGITGGRLRIANPVSIGNIAVSNASLEFSNTATATLFGDITGNGEVIKSGSGAMWLLGASSYSGGTTVNAGNLVVQSPVSTGTYTNNAVLEFAPTVDTTTSANVEGTGVFAKRNATRLTMNGTISQNEINVMEGRLVLGQKTDSNIVTNGTIEFAQTGTTTSSSNISGDGAVVKSGPGKLSLLGQMTNTAGVTVNGGHLILYSAPNSGFLQTHSILEVLFTGDTTLGSHVSGPGQLMVGGSGVLRFSGGVRNSGLTTVNSGVLRTSVPTTNGDFQLNGGLWFDHDSTTPANFTGDLAGSGSFSKYGTGSLRMSGATTHNGGTAVNAGTLILENPPTVGNYSGSGALELATPADITIGGNFSGSGTLLKSGASIVTLTGTYARTGNLTVSAGRLNFEKTPTGLGNSTVVTVPAWLSFSATSNFTTGATFVASGMISKSGPGVFTPTGFAQLTGTFENVEGATVLSGTNGMASILNGGVLRLNTSSFPNAPAISGSGSLRVLANQTVTGLNGELSYSGQTTLESGSSLTIQRPSASSSTSIGGALTYNTLTNRSVNAAITGAGSLTKTGAGTLTLGNAGGFTGTTNVNQGRLILSSVPAGNWTSGSFSVGTELEFRPGGVTTPSGAMTGAGTIILNTATGGLKLGSTSGFGGLFSNLAGSLTLSGTINASSIVNNDKLRFETPTFNSSTTISGPGSLTVGTTSSIVTPILRGELSHTGKTTLESGSRLEMQKPSAVSPILNDGFLILSPTTDRTISAEVTGTGLLCKEGTGTLTLGNAGGYSGNLSARAGKLILANLPAGNLPFSSVDVPGELELQLAGQSTMNASPSGGGTLTVTSATGGLTLPLSEFFDGGIKLPSGSLTMSGKIGAKSFVNDGNLIFTTGLSFPNKPSISGTGSVSFTSPNAIQIALDGAMSHTGKTTFAAGTKFLVSQPAPNSAHQIDGTLALFNGPGTTISAPISGAGTLIHVLNGTLTLKDTSDFKGSLQFGGGGQPLVLNKPPTAATIDGDGVIELATSESSEMGGSIGGYGALIKTGVGTTTLTGPYTRSGAFRAMGGRLVLANNADLWMAHVDAELEVRPSSVLTMTSTLTGIGKVILDTASGGLNLPQTSGFSGTFTNTRGTLTMSGEIGAKSFENDASLIFTTGLSFPNNPSISGTGSVSFTSPNTTQISLLGDLSYTGSTSFAAGTNLLMSQPAANSAHKIDGTAEFQLGSSRTFTSPTTGSGSLIKSGGSTLTLEDSSGFTGMTTVNEGTLVLRKQQSTGNFVVNGGLQLIVDEPATMNGSFSGSGSLKKEGVGSLVLAGPVSGFNEAINVNEGRLSLANLTSGSWSVNILSVSGELELKPSGFFATAHGLYGDGHVIVNSVGGGLAVEDSSFFDGRFTIASGALALSGTTAVREIVNDGGLIFSPGARTRGLRSITGSGSVLLKKPGSQVTYVGGDLSYTGSTTISAGTNVTIDRPSGASAHMIDGNAEFRVYLDRTMTSPTTGIGALVKSSDGVLTLKDTSGFTGSATVNEGTLVMQQPNGSGTYTTNSQLALVPSVDTLFTEPVTGTGSLTIRGTSQLTFANNILPTGGVDIEGGTLKTSVARLQTDVRSTGGTLELEQTSAGTFTRSFTGEGAFRKTGTRSLFLLSPLENTGGMTVGQGPLVIGGEGTVKGGLTVESRASLVNSSGGELVIEGRSYNRGEVNTVDGSATTFSGLVSGTGRFTGAGNVAFNGGFAPGASPGKVTFQGDMTLGSSNVLTMEIGGTTLGTQYDHISVEGIASLNGGLNVVWYNGFAASLGQSFHLFDFATTQGTFSTVTLPTLSSGLLWNTSGLYTMGTVSVEAVPEPATLAALGLGAMALLRRRKVSR